MPFISKWISVISWNISSGCSQTTRKKVIPLERDKLSRFLPVQNRSLMNQVDMALSFLEVVSGVCITLMQASEFGWSLFLKRTMNWILWVIIECVWVICTWSTFPSAIFDSLLAIIIFKWTSTTSTRRRRAASTRSFSRPGASAGSSSWPSSAWTRRESKRFWMRPACFRNCSIPISSGFTNTWKPRITCGRLLSTARAETCWG